MNIGANSTFSVGGSHDYIQSGGTTTLTAGTSRLAVASGHSVDLNGGTLQGIGTLQGNLVEFRWHRSAGHPRERAGHP